MQRNRFLSSCSVLPCCASLHGLTVLLLLLLLTVTSTLINNFTFAPSTVCPYHNIQRGSLPLLMVRDSNLLMCSLDECRDSIYFLAKDRPHLSYHVCLCFVVLRFRVRTVPGARYRDLTFFSAFQKNGANSKLT